MVSATLMPHMPLFCCWCVWYVDVPSHGQRGGENKYRSEQQPKVSRRFVHSRFFRGVANEVGVTLMLK